MAILWWYKTQWDEYDRWVNTLLESEDQFSDWDENRYFIGQHMSHMARDNYTKKNKNIHQTA